MERYYRQIRARNGPASSIRRRRLRRRRHGFVRPRSARRLPVARTPERVVTPHSAVRSSRPGRGRSRLTRESTEPCTGPGGLGLPRVKRAPRRSSTPIGHPSSVSTAPGRFPSSIRRNNSARLVPVRRGGRADGGHLGRALFKCHHEPIQGYSWAGPSAGTSTAMTCPRHHPSTIFRERIGASRTRSGSGSGSGTIDGRGRYG